MTAPPASRSAELPDARVADHRADLGRAAQPYRFLLVALVMAVLLHRSVFGRYLFAVGRNEEAARYSGINTRA